MFVNIGPPATAIGHSQRRFFRHCIQPRANKRPRSASRPHKRRSTVETQGTGWRGRSMHLLWKGGIGQAPPLSPDLLHHALNRSRDSIWQENGLILADIMAPKAVLQNRYYQHRSRVHSRREAELMEVHVMSEHDTYTQQQVCPHIVLQWVRKSKPERKSSKQQSLSHGYS